jgi:hypothetical protein
MARNRTIALTACGLLAAAAADATSFTNVSGISVDFPAGAVSFADELVSFAPGIIFNPARGYDQPLPAYLNGSNTIGVPDFSLAQSITCFSNPNPTDCKFASLGEAGSLVVKFTDNLLTGSGTPAKDLWIFLAGPGDDTFVDISTDGGTWSNVGAFSGNPGIDIDAFGFGVSDTFAYVRLRDVPLSGQVTGDTLGADIDAIGAISTIAVPLPAAAWLFGSALLVLRRPRDALINRTKNGFAGRI